MKLKLFIVALFLSTQINAISLQDAVKQGLVEVNTQGLGGYTGDVIQLKIKNLSGKLLQLEINAGLFLMPDDSTVQRMMVAQEIPIALETNAMKTIKINAFCSQSRNSSPSATTFFKIGKLATGSLLELAKIISKNKFFSNAAQHAVWCMTDKADLYTINSDNPMEEKILREFVSKATGQPLEMKLYKSGPIQSQQTNNTPAQPQRITRHYVEHIVKDTIRFVNREEGSTTLALYDSTGKELLLFFKDRPLGVGCNVKYTYSFTYANIKEKEVFMRLRKNNGELIYEKRILILE